MDHDTASSSPAWPPPQQIQFHSDTEGGSLQAGPAAQPQQSSLAGWPLSEPPFLAGRQEPDTAAWRRDQTTAWALNDLLTSNEFATWVRRQGRSSVLYKVATVILAALLVASFTPWRAHVPHLAVPPAASAYVTQTATHSSAWLAAAARPCTRGEWGACLRPPTSAALADGPVGHTAADNLDATDQRAPSPQHAPLTPPPAPPPVAAAPIAPGRQLTAQPVPCCPAVATNTSVEARCFLLSRRCTEQRETSALVSPDHPICSAWPHCHALEQASSARDSPAAPVVQRSAPRPEPKDVAAPAPDAPQSTTPSLSDSPAPTRQLTQEAPHASEPPQVAPKLPPTPTPPAEPHHSGVVSVGAAVVGALCGYLLALLHQARHKTSTASDTVADAAGPAQVPPDEGSDAVCDTVPQSGAEPAVSAAGVVSATLSETKDRSSEIATSSDHESSGDEDAGDQSIDIAPLSRSGSFSFPTTPPPSGLSYGRTIGVSPLAPITDTTHDDCHPHSYTPAQASAPSQARPSTDSESADVVLSLSPAAVPPLIPFAVPAATAAAVGARQFLDSSGAALLPLQQTQSASASASLASSGASREDDSDSPVVTSRAPPASQRASAPPALAGLPVSHGAALAPSAGTRGGGGSQASGGSPATSSADSSELQSIYQTLAHLWTSTGHRTRLSSSGVEQLFSAVQQHMAQVGSPSAGAAMLGASVGKGGAAPSADPTPGHLLLSAQLYLPLAGASSHGGAGAEPARIGDAAEPVVQVLSPVRTAGQAQAALLSSPHGSAPAPTSDGATLLPRLAASGALSMPAPADDGVYHAPTAADSEGSSSIVSRTAVASDGALPTLAGGRVPPLPTSEHDSLGSVHAVGTVMGAAGLVVSEGAGSESAGSVMGFAVQTDVLLGQVNARAQPADSDSVHQTPLPAGRRVTLGSGAGSEAASSQAAGSAASSCTAGTASRGASNPDSDGATDSTAHQSCNTQTQDTGSRDAYAGGSVGDSASVNQTPVGARLMSSNGFVMGSAAGTEGGASVGAGKRPVSLASSAHVEEFVADIKSTYERLLSVYKGSRTQLVELFAVQRSLVPASKDQLLALRSESLEGLELIYQHMSATMTEVQSTLDTILENEDTDLSQLQLQFTHSLTHIQCLLASKPDAVASQLASSSSGEATSELPLSSSASAETPSAPPMSVAGAGYASTAASAAAPAAAAAVSPHSVYPASSCGSAPYPAPAALRARPTGAAVPGGAAATPASLRAASSCGSAPYTTASPLAGCPREPASEELAAQLVAPLRQPRQAPDSPDGTQGTQPAARKAAHGAAVVSVTPAVASVCQSSATRASAAESDDYRASALFVASSCGSTPWPPAAAATLRGGSAGSAASDSAAAPVGSNTNGAVSSCGSAPWPPAAVADRMPDGKAAEGSTAVPAATADTGVMSSCGSTPWPPLSSLPGKPAALGVAAAGACAVATPGSLQAILSCGSAPYPVPTVQPVAKTSGTRADAPTTEGSHTAARAATVAPASGIAKPPAAGSMPLAVATQAPPHAARAAVADSGGLGTAAGAPAMASAVQSRIPRFSDSAAPVASVGSASAALTSRGASGVGPHKLQATGRSSAIAAGASVLTAASAAGQAASPASTAASATGPVKQHAAASRSSATAATPAARTSNRAGPSVVAGTRTAGSGTTSTNSESIVTMSLPKSPTATVNKVPTKALPQQPSTQYIDTLPRPTLSAPSSEHEPLSPPGAVQLAKPAHSAPVLYGESEDSDPDSLRLPPPPRMGSPPRLSDPPLPLGAEWPWSVHVSSEGAASLHLVDRSDSDSVCGRLDRYSMLMNGSDSLLSEATLGQQGRQGSLSDGPSAVPGLALQAGAARLTAGSQGGDTESGDSAAVSSLRARSVIAAAGLHRHGSVAASGGSDSSAARATAALLPVLPEAAAASLPVGVAVDGSEHGSATDMLAALRGTPSTSPSSSVFHSPRRTAFSEASSPVKEEDTTRAEVAAPSDAHAMALAV